MYCLLYLISLFSEANCYCTNCLECDGDVCLKCELDYGPETNINSKDYGKCFKCHDFTPHCTRCNDDVHKCIECDKENYTIDTDEKSQTKNKCISCPKNCLNCQGLEYGKCSLCVDGYGPDADKKCNKCVDSNCLTCSNDSNQCTKCKDGYNVTQGKCISCEDPNCQSCLFDYSECNYCNDGYYLARDENNKLNGKCDKINNYVENCITGSLDNQGIFTCKKCDIGYGLVKNKCQLCTVNNCKECNDDVSICNHCLNDLRNIDGKECFSCTEIDENCILCNKNYCSECKNGYIVTDGTKCTIPNDEFCSTINYGVCDYCLYGYGFDENKEKCYKCEIENCKYCDKNYKLCEECEYNTNCDICDNTGTCTKCGYGFVLQNGKCMKCQIENCKLCYTDIAKCDQCFLGYRQESYTKCTQCSDINCEICHDDINRCTHCKDGYGLDYRKGTCDYGKCTKCLIDNCIECNGNPNYCNKCDQSHPDCFDRNKIENENDVFIGECPDKGPDDNDNSGNSNSSDDQYDIGSESEGNKDIYSDNYNDSDNDDTGSKSNNKKLSTGAIVGIAIGCIAAVGLTIGLLVYFLVCKKVKVGNISS